MFLLYKWIFCADSDDGGKTLGSRKVQSDINESLLFWSNTAVFRPRCLKDKNMRVKVKEQNPSEKDRIRGRDGS